MTCFNHDVKENKKEKTDETGEDAVAAAIIEAAETAAEMSTAAENDAETKEAEEVIAAAEAEIDNTSMQPLMCMYEDEYWYTMAIMCTYCPIVKSSVSMYIDAPIYSGDFM